MRKINKILKVRGLLTMTPNFVDNPNHSKYSQATVAGHLLRTSDSEILGELRKTNEKWRENKKLRTPGSLARTLCRRIQKQSPCQETGNVYRCGCAGWLVKTFKALRPPETGLWGLSTPTQALLWKHNRSAELWPKHVYERRLQHSGDRASSPLI